MSFSQRTSTTDRVTRRWLGGRHDDRSRPNPRAGVTRASAVPAMPARIGQLSSPANAAHSRTGGLVSKGQIAASLDRTTDSRRLPTTFSGI